MPDHTVQIFNEKVVSQKFMRQSRAAGNARVAFRAIADMLRDSTAQRFDAEGPGWKPVTSKWAARKKGPRILHESGALRKSVTKSGARGSIAKIGQNSLEFGSKLPYAARHQFGFQTTPARPFLVTTAADRKQMRQIMANHLLAPFSRSPKAIYMPRFTNLPRR